jgi:hypothetical protein
VNRDTRLSCHVARQDWQAYRTSAFVLRPTGRLRQTINPADTFTLRLQLLERTSNKTNNSMLSPETSRRVYYFLISNEHYTRHYSEELDKYKRAHQHGSGHSTVSRGALVKSASTSMSGGGNTAQHTSSAVKLYTFSTIRGAIQPKSSAVQIHATQQIDQRLRHSEQAH